MTKPKAKIAAAVKAPDPAPVKSGKTFKAINSSDVCQLTRRADRTFGITV